MTKLEHEHDERAITYRLGRAVRLSYLRDWVYGGIDGAVTTFAIVAGVAGAGLSSGIILVLGLANLLADGFSMAASNYAGTTAEREDYERLRAIEEKHLALAPEGERAELRFLLRQKGLAGSELEQSVATISSSRELWIDLMLAGEYGLAPASRHPLAAALYTFTAFVVCGAVPLMAFALNLPQAFDLSTVAVAVVFFAIGSLKSIWSVKPWWRSGGETLAIGAVAAAVAYGVGHLLSGLVAA